MPYVQEFTPGERVVVRARPTSGEQEPFPGTVLAEGYDGSYFVLLDDGAGEGWWSENEMTRTAIRATAAHEAEVQRRMAAEDYPEIGEAVAARPDLVAVMDETEYLRSLSRTALYLPLGQAPQGSAAYQEGYDQGMVGVARNPSSDDPAYMADFALGWARGVKARSSVPEPRLTPTLPADEPNLPEMNFDPEMGGPGWLHSHALATTAGIVDFLRGSDTPSETWAGPGRNWSFDVCRFRRESHCWLPKELNREVSDRVGYAVWVPEDRGHCKRVSHDAQRACPLYQPGPNEVGGLTDATIPWEEGGQRGIPAVYPTQKISAKDTDGFAWHYNAAWTDVRAKAVEIERAGQVRVLSVQMHDELHPETYYGQVMSTTGALYTTGLTFEPGTWRVAAWECDCAWAQYAWGRTRQWVKYEGRMCSHALAVVFEMQRRGMQGMPDDEDEIAPDWIPREGSRVTREDYPVVQALLDTGMSVADVQATLARHGVETAKVGVRGTIRGRVNGQVLDLEFADGTVLLHGQPYTGPVHYPEYHPDLGLHYVGSKDEETTMTTQPGDFAWGIASEAEAPPTHEADLTVAASRVAWTVSPEDPDVYLSEPVEGMVGIVTALDGGPYYVTDYDLPLQRAWSWDVEEEESGRGLASGVTMLEGEARQAAEYFMFNHAERREEVQDDDICGICGGGPYCSHNWRAKPGHTGSLTTTAADVFSRREQDEIIGEGEGRTASNLDRLDLAGTHYAPLDDMTHYNDDDTLWP